MNKVLTWYKKTIEYRYSTILLVLFLMTLHFLSGYPGGMSVDTFNQFNQAITSNFIAHNPPITAMLWSVLNRVYTGPQLMLLLHLALLWGSVLFFYYSDLSNRYKPFYFIIPLAPNILSGSVMIWKDISFANAYLFVFSGCIYYLYCKKKANPIVLIIFVLIAFYASAAKFQAKFIIPILCFLIVSVAINRGLLLKLIYTAILSIILISANAYIIKKYAEDNNYWQMRYIFDIARTAIDSDDESLIPDHVKEHNNYDFMLIKKILSRMVNPIVFSKDQMYEYTTDQNKLTMLEDAYVNMLKTHPITYLTFRADVFYMLMKTSPEKYVRIYGNFDGLAEKFGIYESNNILKNLVVHFLKIYPKFLQKNLISLILLIIYTLTICSPDTKGLDKKILGYFVLVGLSFSAVLFFTIMSYDYRYYYLVRLFTFFAIPIYLKLISNKLNNIKPEMLTEAIKNS